MSPIVVSWPGEAAPGNFTFLLSKAALDAILTQDVLAPAFPQSTGGNHDGTFYPGQTPPGWQLTLPTQTNWVGLLTSPAQNPEPNLIVAILDAALLGGGMTGQGDSSLPTPDAKSTCVAQRLYFGNPLLARSTCAQIVAACIAAG